jgi:hypothetical protein
MDVSNTSAEINPNLELTCFLPNRNIAITTIVAINAEGNLASNSLTQKIL